LARPALRQCVTVVYELQHSNALIATNALRPFFGQSGGQAPMSLMLGNIGNEAAIVFSGPQDVVASALRLVQAADVPTPSGNGGQLDARIEAMFKQNEELRARMAALEQLVRQKEQ
jgi:hypothetical protein